MKKRRIKDTSGPDRAGNAGIIATFLFAFGGIFAGALSSYLSEHGASARAARQEMAPLVLRKATALTATDKARDAIVDRVVATAAKTVNDLERLPAPLPIAPSASTAIRPKIIIVFDDMGIDKRAFDRVMNLPGPVTFSFLPYADGIKKLAQRAADRGDAIMLHLPMEPKGDADPGPYALTTDMTVANFLRTLDWNLSRLDGYSGVNNHMGSLLTTDAAAMETILGALRARGLFFLDSLTTGDSVARQAGAAVGADIFVRDVFLDADAGKESVIRQLALVEAIARETGYAVAICHPRKDTIDIIGAWLTSAPSRGFDLAPVTALADIVRTQNAIVAEAPELRL